MKDKKLKICGITTRVATARVMVDGFLFLNENGYETTIICEEDDHFSDYLKSVGIHYIPVKMSSGNVSIGEVCRCIGTFIRIFKKERFDAIQYASCNASLYACIAGSITKIPVRILCQWGLTYLGFDGVKRKFYKLVEKFTCYLSTNIQPDSHTNLQFAIDEHLLKPSKGNVIWNGSACGLDFNRFDIEKKKEWRNEILGEYNIPLDSKVYGFVGRVVRDKGINELLSSFLMFTQRNATNKIYLLIVGPEDGMSELDGKLLEEVKNNNQIIFTGRRNDINKCYACFDFVVMPSYREGLSMVLLESAAMGVPVISSNINGSTDFVIDGFNGLLCKVKSVESLLTALERSYSLSSDNYSYMSTRTYKKAQEEYDIEKFRQYYLEDRNRIINGNAQNE